MRLWQTAVVMMMIIMMVAAAGKHLSTARDSHAAAANGSDVPAIDQQEAVQEATTQVSQVYGTHR